MDIELVIKIPEDLYKATVNGMNTNEIWDLRLAVANATLLPKRHGRLIDETDLKTLFELDDRLWWSNAVEEFTDLPTIIEADNTESEG